MADVNQLKQARAVYKTMRDMFDARELHYESDEDNWSIISGAIGDDLPISLRMRVDPDRMLIIANSIMPFDVPQNRRAEMAIAVSRANYGLPDGNFDYDIESGNVVFRMTSCYRDSLIGSELIEYMLVVTFGIVDDYNDLLEKVAATDMTVDEIIKTIK